MRMTKPPTASVAWMPIIIPAIRALKIRVASSATPINAASVISEVAMMPKKAAPWSSPLGGPRSARAGQLRPPTARSPCRAASDYGGVLLSVNGEPQALSPTKRRLRG